MTVSQQEERTFESLVDEFRQRSRAMIGHELHADEIGSPRLTQAFDESGPPYKSFGILTETDIKAYAKRISDDNPLYTDREYAKNGPYGCIIAPGTVLLTARAGLWHGARREGGGGYPVLNFHAGSALEFFDVIRVGTGFKGMAKAHEMIEKPGARGGQMFVLTTDAYFWDRRGDLLGKNYGTVIMIPREELGAGRVMPVERLGEKMMYDRGVSKYSKEQVDEAMDLMSKGAKRRGKEVLYWEDVKEGDKLPAWVLPPWTDQDYGGPGGGSIRRGPVRWYHFEEGHWIVRHGKIGSGAEEGWAFTHPVSRWPWSAADEHGDALMAAYRGQSLPFDNGVQRGQIPQGLISNWMGDHGFIRKLQVAVRRPMYYGDLGVYSAEVVKKFKDVQTGEDGPGAVPGERTYHAVGIKVEGRNQVDEIHLQGSAVVYLPSRESGMVQLPVPHLAMPPAVPYETFYRGWF